jgi:hypothetical protein
MKTVRPYITFIILSVCAISVTGQNVNAIHISPSEPTFQDTILVISDFSYSGACAFGLVYSYTYTTDTSVLIAPTFCGHFVPDSVMCQSIDTFKIAPLSAGEYQVNIEYHQGSICPISDFDATIATFDTFFTVSGTNQTRDLRQVPSPQMIVSPNPADSHIAISIKNFKAFPHAQLIVTNTFGKIVAREEIEEEITRLNTSHLSGAYVISLLDSKGAVMAVSKILIQ